MKIIEAESVQLFLLGDMVLVCAIYGLDTLALVSCFAEAASEGTLHWLAFHVFQAFGPFTTYLYLRV